MKAAPRLEKISACIFVHLLLVVTTLNGQILPVRMNYYGLKDGLPTRDIRDVERTEDGLIWMSTGVSITRFDGYRFQNFSNKKTSNINQVIDIKGAGRLVLDAFDNLVIRVFERPDSLEFFNTKTLKTKALNFSTLENTEGNIKGLALDEKKNVYLLSKKEDDFYIYQIKKNQDFLLLHKIEDRADCNLDSHGLSISENNDFLIYNNCEKELITIKNYGEIKYTELPFDKADILFDYKIFHHDRQGRLWISGGQKDSLLLIENGKQTVFDKIPQTEKLNRIWEDAQGNLIFGVLKSNYVNTLYMLTVEDKVFDLQSVIDEESRRIVVSGEDFRKKINLSSVGGFYEFFFAQKNKRIKSYLAQDLKEGEYGNIMRGFVEDEKGTIFIGKSTSELFKLDSLDNKLIPIIKLDAEGQVLEERGCFTHFIYDKGKLYFSTCDENRDGHFHKYEIEKGKWEELEIPSRGTFGRISIQKSESEFWLFCYNRNTTKPEVFLLNFEDKSVLPIHDDYFLEKEKNVFQCAKREDNEVIWIGSSRALIKFNTKEKIFSTFKPSEKESFSVTDILIESDRLLVGTAEEGLWIFDLKTETFEKWTLPSNEEVLISDNTISSILPLEKGEYFIGTGNGLNYINTNESVFKDYHKEDGLSNEEYNLFSSMYSSKGDVFFGGTNGFDVFRKEDLIEEETLKKIVFTRFFKFDGGMDEEEDRYDNLDFNSPIVLSPQNLYFGFDFTLPNIKDIENNRFSFFLEGVDQGYSPPSVYPSVKYNRLPAGKYVFHIQVFDNQGNIRSSDFRVPILVEEVFYKKTNFILLSLLSLLLLTYFLTQGYTRKKVEEKSKVIQEEERVRKKMAELELEALRAQLNPHFVFNALGAIQYFISENNTENATSYLADFARLMRLFLEASKRQFITLEEELELIKLYVHLEQMRFNHIFSVEYRLDENSDLLNYEIPSSLLQPFVENAINHGLFNLKSGGKLLIKIEEEEENLLKISIEDNGIGRKKANIIREKSIKKHKSRATQIIQERIASINTKGDFFIKFITEDVDSLAENTGTRVVLFVREVE